ncbi:hypothetical protein [Flavobacterium terrisoli]|uniref:Nmad2 family putative nucleotide modification protein n=1 Tax=Flavobacterium terrisoli TaxID=3242195 RepID=UPI002542F036|nr:hypothetical protein [Flavobacterium buctense]
MSKIYSYVLRFDDGAAPNPFWEVCTLAICKPAIRRKAEPGSWVIGTGSKYSKCNDGNTYDFSGMLVYAMKIEDSLSLKKYDEHCQTHLPAKIPDKRSLDWRLHLGDSIYDYSKGLEPSQRKGKHNLNDQPRDLSGKNVLLSKHFYYFGENPILLPQQFQRFVKKNQGHKIIRYQFLVAEFEKWISTLGPIGMRSDPQLSFQTILEMEKEIINNCTNSCSHLKIKKYSHGSNCNL